MNKPNPSSESSVERYRLSRICHWDELALKMDTWTGWGGYYHKRLIEVFRFIIPPGQRILEIGCAQGDLLAALAPSYGVGVDFSPAMIVRARTRHPQLTFIECDAHDLILNDGFDYIVLSDLVNDLWDVQEVLNGVLRCTTSRTRVVINTYSRLWELPLLAVKKLGLAKPTLFQNWLTVDDISGLMDLADMEVITHWEEILLPLNIPVLGPLMNEFVVKLWPFKWFAMTHFIIAAPAFASGKVQEDKPLVSVIVPARNEAGNIAQIFSRVPDMGLGTELVFVEGNSTDDTYKVIEQAIKEHPERQCRLLRQTGKGKGDAVRWGMSQARGDILMILDADLTVPPEDLPRFYDALVDSKGEFINGVRLVYPMEKEAMRFINLVGNKFFSLVFSWLLGQPIKDTLCGTKVLWKADYDRIAANRSYFGDFDPFGDFDLLFGAAKLNLRICQLPVRYCERTYGTTNIQRWRHGWLLLRMVLFALKRIKFV